MAEEFETFEIVHVPREENVCTYLLEKLTSTKKPGLNKIVIHEPLIL